MAAAVMVLLPRSSDRGDAAVVREGLIETEK
jgi:hypothetical protein